MTGAVSTKTFTSQAKRETRNWAKMLQLPFMRS